MSQYFSRFHIKVTSPEVWKRFEDEDDADWDLASLAEKKTTSWIIDESSYDEDELEGIVPALAKTRGSDGIIISDTTNINVDPYNYCVFYLGDKVKVIRPIGRRLHTQLLSMQTAVAYLLIHRLSNLAPMLHCLRPPESAIPLKAGIITE